MSTRSVWKAVALTLVISWILSFIWKAVALILLGLVIDKSGVMTDRSCGYKGELFLLAAIAVSVWDLVSKGKGRNWKCLDCGLSLGYILFNLLSVDFVPCKGHWTIQALYYADLYCWEFLFCCCWEFLFRFCCCCFVFYLFLIRTVRSPAMSGMKFGHVWFYSEQSDVMDFFINIIICIICGCCV